jgi:hypothetical protein
MHRRSSLLPGLDALGLKSESDGMATVFANPVPGVQCHIKARVSVHGCKPNLTEYSEKACSYDAARLIGNK